MGHLMQGLAEHGHDVVCDEAREGACRGRHRTVFCGMLVDGVAPRRTLATRRDELRPSRAEQKTPMSVS